MKLALERGWLVMHESETFAVCASGRGAIRLKEVQVAKRKRPPTEVALLRPNGYPTSHAMEVDPVFDDDLKPVRNGTDGWGFIAFTLEQTCQACLAAQRTVQPLVPLIVHAGKSQTPSMVSN